MLLEKILTKRGVMRRAHMFLLKHWLLAGFERWIRSELTVVCAQGKGIERKIQIRFHAYYFNTVKLTLNTSERITQLPF